MSIENVQSFRELVGKSQELQTQVGASYAAGDVASVIRLGAQRGLEFTEQDLFAVFSRFLSDELPESQLEKVVGGVGGAGGSLSNFEMSVISALPPGVIGADCGSPAVFKAPTAKF